MRPWQGIVPEEERAIFDKAGFGQREPFGKKPALIVVDVTRAFLGSKPENVLKSIEEYRSSCGDVGWVSLPYIQRLLQAFREEKLPVVYTVPMHEIPTTKLPPGHTPQSFIGPKEGLEIASEVAPLADEMVLAKPKASGFFDTCLGTYLRYNGVDSLLMAGTSTSGCVRATVVDGCSHGFAVFVVEECVFDRSRFFHLASLYDMNAKYGNVVTLDEALSYLESLRRTPVAV